MTHVNTSADYERAVAIYAAGEGDRAIAELQERLKQDPDAGLLWELLGTLAFANADYGLAQSATEQASLLAPLTWMLHEAGRSEDGARLLERVPCAEFSCIRCLSRMQAIFVRVGNSEQAGICRERLKVLLGQLPMGHDDATHEE